MNALLLMAAFTPVLLAPLSALQLARWFPLIATIPAVAAAMYLPQGTQVEVPWLLLGAHFQLDAIGQIFLLFSALMWLFAALFLLRIDKQQQSPIQFRLYFLAAMGGNFLLILAADIITFYVGFALMGLSAYPLVLRRSQQARFAGRIYLAFTLLGELALFSAIAILFSTSDSLLFSANAALPLYGITTALLLFAFGIKLALPALHSWLPMVYRTAPLVTAAVLSGPMMNAGLLGWMRFIPAGQPGHQFWGELLLVLGTIGIALGVCIGVLQRDPRAVLAYSSIAKMGFISALFGFALKTPELAPTMIIALVAFAMHHLLVKSSLFLALFEWQKQGPQYWLLFAIALLAVSLIAAPFTGGAGAKQAIKDALDGELAWLLVASATGTALLMLRFIFILTEETPGNTLPAVATWPWLLLLPLAIWGPYWPNAVPGSLAGLWSVVVASPIAMTLWWLATRYPGLMPRVPPGDMIYPLLRYMAQQAIIIEQIGKSTIDSKRMKQKLLDTPGSAGPLAVPGLLFLLLCLLLFGSLLLPV